MLAERRNTNQEKKKVQQGFHLLRLPRQENVGFVSFNAMRNVELWPDHTRGESS